MNLQDETNKMLVFRAQRYNKDFIRELFLDFISVLRRLKVQNVFFKYFNHSNIY